MIFLNLKNKTAKSKTKNFRRRSTKDIKYDYKVDNIFFTEAFKNILNNKIHYSILSLKKAFSFFFYKFKF